MESRVDVKMGMRDFGSGLSVDELVGLSAVEIIQLSTPSETVFLVVQKAAERMVQASLRDHILVEIWEDGHTVWSEPELGLPVVVSPLGRITKSKSSQDS